MNIKKIRTQLHSKTTPTTTIIAKILTKIFKENNEKKKPVYRAIEINRYKE